VVLLKEEKDRENHGPGGSEKEAGARERKIRGPAPALNTDAKKAKKNVSSD